MRKYQKRFAAVNVCMFLFFLVLVALVLFPLFCITLAAFKPSTELLRNGLNLEMDFSIMSLYNFKQLFSPQNHYFTWYKNSLLITVLQTLGSLFISAVVAYGFAMYNFRFKNLAFTCVLMIMMVPVEVLMLPLYKQMIAMGLIDTYAGIILPFLAAPVPIFFFRQYLSGLPNDFAQAARVDGANEYSIFSRIFLPLMAPSFAAMGIYQGMMSWNGFLWPLIVIRSQEKMTLPVGLSSLITPYGNNYDTLIAGSVMAIIPILVLFLLFQKYFIAGMTAGGVKG